MIDKTYPVTLEEKPDAYYPDTLYLTRATYTDGKLALLALTDEEGYTEDWDTVSVNLSGSDVTIISDDLDEATDWDRCAYVRQVYMPLMRQLARAGVIDVVGSCAFGLGNEIALKVRLRDLETIPLDPRMS